MKGRVVTDGGGNRAAIWGYLSLVLVLGVSILSVPRVGVVPYFFGYTPPWMFAMLCAGIAAGVLASIRNRFWLIAVGVSSFALILMLVFNNA
jgi:dolichyl-phosphate-mannose--protein O-mannosyl transferase